MWLCRAPVLITATIVLKYESQCTYGLTIDQQESNSIFWQLPYTVDPIQQEKKQAQKLVVLLVSVIIM